MFSPVDLRQLADKGITTEQVERQLSLFKSGFPYLVLQAPATPGQGILQLTQEQTLHYANLWDNYLRNDVTVVKFVPASGAASRMFKDLFEFVDASYELPSTDFERDFFANITSFAFYDDLDKACIVNYGRGIQTLMAAEEYKPIVRALLHKEGLNYGALPKGLLKFHRYADTARTAMEEHLSEGAMYAANAGGKVNLHFTVSSEHQPLFKALVKQKKEGYEKCFGVKYNITFSVQKPSTDTVAADTDNQPFRQGGAILFRPGGHGALIENLNDIEADVIFVKNIDNVVPDWFKEDTITYKKVIAGLLIEVQKQVNEYITLLRSGRYTIEKLREIITFMHKRLFVTYGDTKYLEDADLALFLLGKLRRPLRVCGMVRNVGEPGGGPFLAFNTDGTVSLQILESSQIDKTDPDSVAMFGAATHFNPVDLVCAVKDEQGNKYDLPQYVDPLTGFISTKSKDGKELKALELPGLWNGAMSDWNTLFVEAPISTFNPVKTVNDLLRPQHQKRTTLVGQNQVSKRSV